MLFASLPISPCLYLSFSVSFSVFPLSVSTSLSLSISISRYFPLTTLSLAYAISSLKMFVWVNDLFQWAAGQDLRVDHLRDSDAHA